MCLFAFLSSAGRDCYGMETVRTIQRYKINIDNNTIRMGSDGGAENRGGGAEMVQEENCSKKKAGWGRGGEWWQRS